MVPDRDPRDAPLSVPATAAEPRDRPPAGAGAGTGTGTPVVAVVRSDNPRGAVAEALALLDAEIRAALAGPAVVLPVLGRGRADSAHPGALSALLDVLLAAGLGPVTIASGHPDAARRFDRLGFAGECWGRPVSLRALGRDEAEWGPLRVGAATLRMSRTVRDAGCRVALAPLAASGRGPASWPAWREALHPDDRRVARGLDPDGPAELHLSVVVGPIGWPRRSVVALAGLDGPAVEGTAARLRGAEARGPRRPGRPDRVGPGAAGGRRVAVVGDAVGPLRPGPAPGLRADRAHDDRGGDS